MYQFLELENSRLFKMYKIRTMVNAHKDRSTLEEINERQAFI